MDEHIREIEKAFSAMRTIVGTSVIWKTTLPLLPNPLVDEEYRSHCSEFCRRVKHFSWPTELRCIENDRGLISRKVFDRQEAFFNTCHAGGCELVIPFFREDRYVGMVMCGPFRREESKCGFREAEREFKRLPLITGERGKAYVTVIRLIVTQLMPKLEMLEEPLCYPGDGSRVFDERIGAAIRYMELHFKQKIRHAGLAKMCAVSESHFSHLFHASTGVGSREYLQRVRLHEACRLLSGTNLAVSEVAHQVGIESQSRLAFLLKRQLGISPLNYRRKNQGLPEKESR